ncbi:hypothetical protein, partial [Gordonia sp. FQ]|uniref:hypothetical protein n=1 Tax=Gordonia sp. FQ TaxID=3446634 RepID=UPI003F86FD68
MSIDLDSVLNRAVADLTSMFGTHVTKRPCSKSGPVPISDSSTSTTSGDITPRIMRETGALSHTGPGDRSSSVKSYLEGNG